MSYSISSDTVRDPQCNDSTPAAHSGFLVHFAVQLSLINYSTIAQSISPKKMDHLRFIMLRHSPRDHITPLFKEE